MKTQAISRLLTLVFCLSLISMSITPATAHADTFIITTQVTAGQGRIDTVGPLTDVIEGDSKTFQIRPAEGWMIEDVQLDGVSVGPVRVLAIPFVHANHTVTASFVPFDQVQATNVSTKVTRNARVLMLGTPVGVEFYLNRLLERDTSRQHEVHITSITEASGSVGLLGSYYANRRFTAYLPVTFEQWDYIVPFDDYDQQLQQPELFMEAVRLYYNRSALVTGKNARWLLPIAWPKQGLSDKLDETTANVYRIAAGFRSPVLPCGIAWDRLVRQEGISSFAKNRDLYVGYLCSLIIYAQLFEQNGADVGYTPPFSTGFQPTPEDEAMARKIEQMAWDTWQSEKTQTHYSGAHQGNSTPIYLNDARGYHFGTSTRQRSVDKMIPLIADRDQAFGTLIADAANEFVNVTVPGEVQNNLAANNYTYMWRQNKESPAESLTYLNDTVRGQFGEDPYFIWYQRYYDAEPGQTTEFVGPFAWLEANITYTDNQDTTRNPNRKSRAPLSYVGWGRLSEERIDLELMEADRLHAAGPVMSMFAAQAYALLSGRDASAFGSWDYDPNSVEGDQSRYAQRLGYEVIMQAGTLDINQPYDGMPGALFFNDNSVFKAPPYTFYAVNDRYVVASGSTLVLNAPGVMANDFNIGSLPITVQWSEGSFTSDIGSWNAFPDGSMQLDVNPEARGSVFFQYNLTNGERDGNVGLVWVDIIDSSTLNQKSFVPVVSKNGAAAPPPTPSPPPSSAPVYFSQFGSQGFGNGLFRFPIDVAVDSAGNVFVTDSQQNIVQKFDKDGNFLHSWNYVIGQIDDGIGNTYPIYMAAFGIAVDSQGHLYITDVVDNVVYKFDNSGNYITHWGSYGSDAGLFSMPFSIAIDSQDNVYVADTDNQRIQKFSSNGTFVTQWGSLGSGDGQFLEPYRVAVSPQGNVYVLDRKSGRIQYFTSDGAFLGKFGSFGVGNGRFARPFGIDVDADGNVYVVDDLQNRIQKFDAVGNYILEWGSAGTGNGQFKRATSIAIGPNGRSYVTDTENFRVLIFAQP